MSALLVPIQLDVLVVRGGSERWALTAMQPPAPGAPGVIPPAPFQELATSRPLGAYLHWAMPDGLGRGTSGGDGRLTFAPLPDRWLVVRLSGPLTEGKRQVRAWLIPDAGAQTPVVLDALSGAPLPPPTPKPRGPLTVGSYGDVGWVAYYDNVAGRMGLHDPLTGVEGPIAYLVCGWYTDPTQDAIRAATASEFAARLAALGFTVDPAQLPSEGAPYPATSVYHGAAVAIGWPDMHWPGDGGILGAELDARPEPGTVDVALGQTVAEALAALTSDTSGGTSGAARLLEGLYGAALPVLSEPDAPARLDTALHLARFSARPSSSTSEVIWQPASPSSGSFAEVSRSRPRVWHALDPALVLRGAGRGFKHGGDGRFTPTGELECRVEGHTTTAFGVEGTPGVGADVLPGDVLAPVQAAYGAPPVCAALLVELASLDPGSAPDLDAATPDTPSPVAGARAAWWVTWAPPAEGEADPLEGAIIVGTLPSSVAVTAPTRPWTPLHIEWAASYHSSPRGAHDWRLGEADFELPEPPDFPSTGARALAGRCYLSTAAAAALESALDEEDGDAFLSVPEDALSAALDGLTAELRAAAGSSALRAGLLRMDKLRLVDGYGRFVDLLPGGTALAIGAGLAVPTHAGLAALPPRFTAPARVLLRYAAATGELFDAGPGYSPVCGYVVPSPLDGTLGFFDPEGSPRGRLRPDPVTGTAWEEDPGRDPALGTAPSRWLKNPFLGAFADSLLAADVAAAGAAARGQPAAVRTALASLLRVLDATRWTMDTTGRAGDEHLALLLGQPVVVLRATLKLEVENPDDPHAGQATSVPVRLGSLGHREDGLLAYIVGDDTSRVYVVDPAVAALTLKEASPYIDRSGVFYANPGRPVALTLFMVPQSEVHVTTGLLPRKAVGMVRDWTAGALSRLAPAFRYGPVLRHETATRLPVPAEIRGTCRWHSRVDPLTWTSDEIVPLTAGAALPDAPVQLSEGWLQFVLAPDAHYGEQAVQVRVTCISSLRVDGVRQAVLAIGTRNPDGSHFLILAEQAAIMVESGRFFLFVEAPDKSKFEVKVELTPQGTRALRAPDSTGSGNKLFELPECSAWQLTAGLSAAMLAHQAVRMTDGKVLASGGYTQVTYLYNPATLQWAASGMMSTTRRHHAAALLLNGKALVCGGASGNADATAELYNPQTGTWALTGKMGTPRRYHTATLLRTGEVLVVGGLGANDTPLATAEIYNPAAGTWAPTASMATSRTRPQAPDWSPSVASQHTATLLPDGRVLVTGGRDANGVILATAEVYDPVRRTWTQVESMRVPRCYHAATSLKDGKVLVSSGWSTPEGTGNTPTAELFDPATGTWTATGNLLRARRYHTSTLLPDGKVIITGGHDPLGGGNLTSAERYDPVNGTWTATGALNVSRYRHTSTLLPDGGLLVMGGFSSTSSGQLTAEVYTP
ncbi:MAG TPA: kelch repeat-containing protein [Myxococcaceae bacterium]|nr:kelch repeat-containing protein [Myxococcaceae bacterium]